METLRANFVLSGAVLLILNVLAILVASTIPHIFIAFGVIIAIGFVLSAIGVALPEKAVTTSTKVPESTSQTN